ncbi:MAG: hypothetical protein WBX81_14585, partial [Nitrososphaeraceae archaeon]
FLKVDHSLELGVDSKNGKTPSSRMILLDSFIQMQKEIPPPQFWTASLTSKTTAYTYQINVRTAFIKVK